jgi:hypothetical protein
MVICCETNATINYIRIKLELWLTIKKFMSISIFCLFIFLFLNNKFVLYLFFLEYNKGTNKNSAI